MFTISPQHPWARTTFQLSTHLQVFTMKRLATTHFNSQRTDKLTSQWVLTPLISWRSKISPPLSLSYMENGNQMETEKRWNCKNSSKVMFWLLCDEIANSAMGQRHICWALDMFFTCWKQWIHQNSFLGCFGVCNFFPKISRDVPLPTRSFSANIMDLFCNMTHQEVSNSVF